MLLPVIISYLVAIDRFVGCCEVKLIKVIRKFNPIVWEKIEDIAIRYPTIKLN